VRCVINMHLGRRLSVGQWQIETELQERAIPLFGGILSVLFPPFGRVRSRLGCVLSEPDSGGWLGKRSVAEGSEEGSVGKRSWILQAVEQKMCKRKQARGVA
jgi:hypothetical protein